MKIDEQIINYNDTQFKRDTIYYIKYATRINYLQWIEVREDEGGIYVDISNQPLIYNDDYKMSVTFDRNGIFKVGYSLFYSNNIRLVLDQNIFKQQIKREIMRLNNMQGIIKKMLA